MRTVAAVTLLALAACVPEEEPPSRQISDGDACGAEPLQLLVGVPFEQRDFGQGDRPLRILPPDSAMTMDHRPDRLNVDLDDEGTVIRIWCG